MKARTLAVLLSLGTLSIPAYAQDAPLAPAEKQSTVSEKIDLNKADVATLTGSFKGIGKKRAEAIIAYREAHQGFKSVEELSEVKGIGQHFLEANADKLKETYSVG